MDKSNKSQLDARMYGVWERVKVKNEEMLYKSMGLFYTIHINTLNKIE